MNNHKAIEDYESTCFSCLDDIKLLHVYYTLGRGYGSIYDGFDTSLRVCTDCHIDDLDKWFDEKPVISDEYVENFEHEKDIKVFVNNLPIEGRELFWNRYANDSYMDAQDWVDCELGIMPDEKYTEYGMYSPSEVESYRERFPTCEYPVNTTFNDGSVGCFCPFGASGYEGQETNLNISEECHGCVKYKVRETPIKNMSIDKYNNWKSYTKGLEAVEKYKGLFEEE